MLRWHNAVGTKHCLRGACARSCPRHYADGACLCDEHSQHQTMHMQKASAKPVKQRSLSPQKFPPGWPLFLCLRWAEHATTPQVSHIPKAAELKGWPAGHQNIGTCGNELLLPAFGVGNSFLVMQQRPIACNMQQVPTQPKPWTPTAASCAQPGAPKLS